MTWQRFTFGIGPAVALLAGCGWSQPPLAASSRTTQLLTPAADGNLRVSRTLGGAVGRDLLYVSNQHGDVTVYTYPKGRQIGMLDNFSGADGLCVDKNGDVFVPFIYEFGGTYEFPHGSTSPIAYLGFGYQFPNACSIASDSGDVAVIGGYSGAFATIYHYRPRLGWNLGKTYTDPFLAKAAFCGFDNDDNLFVDGTTSGGSVALTELPRNAKSFIVITLAQSIAAPGQVQWDGKHLAVGDAGVSPSMIYQFDVSGSTATKVGSTTLGKSVGVEQFWIQGDEVIAPDSKRSCSQSETGCIEFYRYPAGGLPTKVITDRNAYGTTVSLAKPK
jgi:hypothetical protein